MKVLILNQAFHPDVVSVAQHAADLAAGLVKEGHDVTVMASRRAYDSPSRLFPWSEVWRGVRIIRVRSTAFGKASHWRRALDIVSFWCSCTMRLALLRRQDVVVAMTAPPLISVLAAAFVRVKGGCLISWIMDLNPDEAAAAGALREGSLLFRGFTRLLKFSLTSSAAIVVLDRFMRNRIAAMGIQNEKMFVLAPWAHDSVICYDEEGRERFRSTHHLTGKFVVMYSGNHSPCHPLETLLEAARTLAEERNIVFLFVGGGSRFSQVMRFARQHSLTNVMLLPYQPLEALAGSLSAADLHVVLMGEKFVGTVHPCKIYNILATGSPFLHIGPSPNHITELAADIPSESEYYAAHGDTDTVVSHIRKAVALGPHRDPAHIALARRFSGTVLVPRFIAILERVGETAYLPGAAVMTPRIAERRPPAV